MRLIHLTIFLILPIVAPAQTLPCPPEAGCYCLIEKADNILNQKDGDYQQALYLYFAAQACDENLTEEAGEKIVSLFEKIENLRLTAEELRKTAEQRARVIQQQQSQLKIEIEAAQLATRKAKAQNLNNLASKAILEEDMIEAFRLMQYANAYDPNNLQWLDNLQKLFVRNQIGYSENELLVPLPTKTLQIENSIEPNPDIGRMLFSVIENSVQILPFNTDLLSIGEDTIQILDWEGTIKSTIVPPVPISGALPLSESVLTWGKDQTLREWGIDGTELLSIHHSAPISKVMTHQESLIKATLTRDSSIHIWSNEWENISSIQLDAVPTDIQFLPQIDKILVIVENSKCIVFNTAGKVLFQFIEADEILELKPAKEEQLLLYQTERSIHGLDWQGNELFSLELEERIVRFDLIPGKNTFAIHTQGDNKVSVYDWNGNQIISFPKTSSEVIYGIFIVPYTNYIVIVTEAQTFIWNWVEENVVELTSGGQPHYGILNTGFQVMPDFSGVLSWSEMQDHAHIWNWKGKEVGRLYTSGEIRDVTPILHDGAGFIISSNDNKVFKWEIQTDKKFFEESLLTIQDIFLLPNGNGFGVWRSDETNTPDTDLVQTKAETTILFLNWNADTIAQLEHEGRILGMEYLDTPYNAYLTWSADSTIRIWNNQFEEVNRLEVSAPVREMTLFGEEQLPIFWLENNNLYIPEQGEIFMDLTSNVESWKILSTENILFWPDKSGAYLYEFPDSGQRRFDHLHHSLGGIIEIPPGTNPNIPSSDLSYISWTYNNITVWDKYGMEPLLKINQQYAEPHATVSGVIPLSSREGFLTWTSSGAIFHFDWDGNIIKTMESESEILGVQLLPDSSGIISWYTDCTLRIWDFEGNELVVLEHNLNAEFGFCQIDGFQFLPSGEGIITWTNMETGFVIWDLQGNHITTMDNRYIDGIKFIPTIHNTLLAWSKGEIKIWSLDPLQTLKTANDIGIGDFTDQEKSKYGIELDLKVDREYLPYPWLRE